VELMEIGKKGKTGSSGGEEALGRNKRRSEPWPKKVVSNTLGWEDKDKRHLKDESTELIADIEKTGK